MPLIDKGIVDFSSRWTEVCEQLKKHGGLDKIKLVPESPPEIKGLSPNPGREKVAVCQYTLDGKFIRRYSCYAEAARITGISRTTIRYCVIGKRSHAKNFIFKKEENNHGNSTET